MLFIHSFRISVCFWVLFSFHKPKFNKIGRKRRSVSESPDTSRDTTPARTIYTPKYTPQPSTAASRKQTIDDDKQYKCHLCAFSTDRLNVIILHNKTHSNDKPLQPVKTPRMYTPVQFYCIKNRTECIPVC